MSASAQEVGQTYDCKIHDCDGTAKQGGMTPKPAAPSAQQGSFESRARDASKRLTAAGKKLDKAKAAASVAVRNVREAQAEWDAALQELGKA